MLSKLPFNAKLHVIETGRAIKGHGMSYKVELVGKKVLLTRLESSKSNIKYIKSSRSLDFLDETKRFKYHINLKVELKKHTSQKGELSFLLFISIK